MSFYSYAQSGSSRVGVTDDAVCYYNCSNKCHQNIQVDSTKCDKICNSACSQFQSSTAKMPYGNSRFRSCEQLCKERPNSSECIQSCGTAFVGAAMRIHNGCK